MNRSRGLHKRRNWAKRRHEAWVQSRINIMRWGIEQMCKGRIIVIEAAPRPASADLFNHIAVDDVLVRQS